VRPPPIAPPAVPNRNSDVFAELIDLLRGYPVDIRSEQHRQALLRDCRYFSFKGLEQKLLPHWRGYNQVRARDEIIIRLEDILKSGLSVAIDGTATTSPIAQMSMPSPLTITTTTTTTPDAVNGRPGPSVFGWVHYARPYVDTTPAELIMQTGNESARLHFPSHDRVPRVEFFDETRVRIARLFQVIATKLNLPPTVQQPLGLRIPSGGADSQPATPADTPLCGQDRVRVAISSETAITLDGQPRSWDWSRNSTDGGDHDQDDKDGIGEASSRKRRRTNAGDASLVSGCSVFPAEDDAWIVKTAQWRLCIKASQSGRQPAECELVAVKIDALSSAASRNASRPFVGL